LLIGESCIDRYRYGICDRLSPEAPVPVLKHLYHEDKDGMAKNVFGNLKNLGVEPLLVTNSEPVVKSRYVDERTKQHLLRVDEGECSRLKPLTLSDIEATAGDLNLFDVILFSDYDKGLITSEFALQVTEKYKDVVFFVDSKKSDLSCYKNCVLKINEKEKAELKMKPEACELIVTVGKNGAIWNGECFPVDNVEVFDVCGAGDTFFAGLVSCFLVTKNLRKSIKFANLCASISVQKFGTYQIEWEDINEKDRY
tara:strand:- start:70 stop:831 length:762 start_codon:yes stop_codon:yes gene_type:complete